MNTNSQLAHQNAINFKENHYERITNVLSNFNRSLTYSEISRYCGFNNPNQVSRRLPELVRQGKITKTDSRVCSIAGSRCSTYTLCIE